MKTKFFKFILMPALLLMIETNLFGQNENFFHINAGYVGTTYRTTTAGISTWYSPGVFGPVIPIEITEKLSGISVGGGYNLHIKKIFRIDFGLDYYFSWSGNRYKNGRILVENSKFHSMNLPIELIGEVEINDNWAFFAFVKPTLSCGIISKSDSRKVNDVVQKIDFDYYEKAKMQRVNFYLGPGAGFRFKNIILKGGVDWAIYKVFKENDIRQVQFYIKLAYAFNYQK